MRVANGPRVGLQECSSRRRRAPLAGLAAGAALALGALPALPAAALPAGFTDGAPPIFEPPRAEPRPGPQIVEPGVVAWLDHPEIQPTVDPGESSLGNGLVNGAFIATIDATGLARKFDGIGYRLAGVRAGIAHVPRVYVDGLPTDMRNLDSAAQRKRLFLRSLLPLILRANEVVRDQRDRLLSIALTEHTGQPLDSESRAFLAQLQEEYGVDPESDDLRELLRRVDVVPPSLALAQAAEESGWGTSRFVREGNAVFGQRTFTAGAGLVPLRRDRNKSHEVLRFSGVQASVMAYLRNLNTHPYYDRFRAERAAMRAQGLPLESDRLVATLDRYSERGQDYIETIRTIMRVNDLDQFDSARLMPVSSHPASDIQTLPWSF